jgi:hypothetical protein
MYSLVFTGVIGLATAYFYKTAMSEVNNAPGVRSTKVFPPSYTPTIDMMLINRTLGERTTQLGTTILGANGVEIPEVGNHYYITGDKKTGWIIIEKKHDVNQTYHYEIHFIPFVHDVAMNYITTMIQATYVAEIPEAEQVPDPATYEFVDDDSTVTDTA